MTALVQIRCRPYAVWLTPAACAGRWTAANKGRRAAAGVARPSNTACRGCPVGEAHAAGRCADADTRTIEVTLAPPAPPRERPLRQTPRDVAYAERRLAVVDAARAPKAKSPRRARVASAPPAPAPARATTAAPARVELAAPAPLVCATCARPFTRFAVFGPAPRYCRPCMVERERARSREYARRVHRSKPRETRRYTHDGLTLTVGEWAVRVGLPESVLRKRLSRCADMSRAIAIGAPRVFGGASIAGRARAAGLSPAIVHRRMRLGMALDDALAAPVRVYTRRAA